MAKYNGYILNLAKFLSFKVLVKRYGCDTLILKNMDPQLFYFNHLISQKPLTPEKITLL